MARIDETTLSSVVADRKEYRWHTLISADVMAGKQEGSLLTLGSHEIKRQELEELSQGQPEATIVETTTEGAAT